MGIPEEVIAMLTVRVGSRVSILLTACLIAILCSKPGFSAEVHHNLVAEAGEAVWRNDLGDTLPFPGEGDDSRGFVRVLTAELEDGESYPDVLETHPRWAANGWIEGRFLLIMPENATFQAKVGFLKGAGGSDGVVFEVAWQVFLPAGRPEEILLYQASKDYDEELASIEIDLSAYAGQTGEFILRVKAGPSSGQDWAVWVNPRIIVETFTYVGPPPTPRTMCFLSGKIYGFFYNEDTLKIRICEAQRLGEPPLEIITCKEGGPLWDVDVSWTYAGDLPSHLEYQTQIPCSGTYRLQPIYRAAENECEWKGQWIASKSHTVIMEGTSQSGYDFTFEPFDQHSPDVSIEFSDEEPEMNERVEIRVLGEDDKGIESVFAKIDKLYADGTSMSGDWEELDFTESFDAGRQIHEASARAEVAEAGVTKLTVEAKVCDAGGNSRLARRELAFSCPRFHLDLSAGGKTASSRSSGVPIFASAATPDADGDGINDCWENTAMQDLNPYIELDEEEQLKEHDEHHAANFVRITPYPDTADPTHLLFYYVVAWSRDYGRFGREEHNGDTEPLIIAWQVVDDYTIQMQCVYIEAHGGCSKRHDLWLPYRVSCNVAPYCDTPERIGGYQELCSSLEFVDRRLKLCASEGKHALYPSCHVCESVLLFKVPILSLPGDLIWAIGGLLKDIITGIIGAIWSLLFGWLEDDHIDDQFVMLDYPSLRDGDIPDEIYPTLHFRGYGAHYELNWRIENDRFPHVRIVLESLYAREETSPAWAGSDEPYMIIVGFSTYPEIDTWIPTPFPPVGDDVDSGEYDEDFPTIVVFEGEVTPETIIGFSASLFEDDGPDTSRATRLDLAEAIRSRLYDRLSSAGRAGECGEALLEAVVRMEFGEDCSGGGLNQFPVYNVGEPDRLLITDLTDYGFPGEDVRGISYGTDRYFCGGLGWDGDCAEPILAKIEVIPDKLRRCLEGEISPYGEDQLFQESFPVQQEELEVLRETESLVVREIKIFPNPVEGIHTSTFKVEGEGIEGIKVEIFNLAGMKVFEQEAVGDALEFHALDSRGRLMANGVYLYIVTVHGFNGKVLRSRVKKLVILR